MAKTPTESYDPEYFAPLFQAEERHFWFRARNRVITEMICRVAKAFSPGYRILEIGCGTGNVLGAVEKVCHPEAIVGMDLFLEGLRYARHRVTCPLVQADLHRPPFSRPFELIGMFDVLEHIQEDEQVLRSLHRLVAPQGYLLLTVPAFPGLWSYFDEASHHVRRYRMKELQNKLRQAGFHTRLMSYYMAGIFPLVWLKRKAARARSSPAASGGPGDSELALEELRIVPVVNEMLARLLGWEAGLLARRIRLPFGTSILALAQREE